MKENEIVYFLIRNKEIGRMCALCFMPQEVQDWCEKNASDLIYYNWKTDKFESNDDMDIVAEDILSLPDDYDVETH